MNAADLLLIRHEDMHQRDIDYFERKGCYDLALAILLDCLQQLAHDRELKLLSTRMEHQWLTGKSDHAPVSCVQVLTTLGMEPGGRLQQMFLRVAMEEPSKAIRMLTSPQAREAFRAMGTSACANADDIQPASADVRADEDGHYTRFAKTPSRTGSPCDSAFEPWIAPSKAQPESIGVDAAATGATGAATHLVPAAPAVPTVPAVNVSTVPRAVRVTVLGPACPAGPDLLRYLGQGELFPEVSLETALEQPGQYPGQYEDEDVAHDRSQWRMRAA